VKAPEGVAEEAVEYPAQVTENRRTGEIIIKRLPTQKRRR
jgi:hypothetical protein